MTRSIPDWREASAYAYLDELSPEDLAWEWLRRNARYKAEYNRCAGTADTETAAGFAREWGLRFPGRPEAMRD